MRGTIGEDLVYRRTLGTPLIRSAACGRLMFLASDYLHFQHDFLGITEL